MKIFISILIIFCFVSGCKNNSNENKITEDDINVRLTKMNVARVGDESKKIDDFIARRSLKTKQTGTGLRFEISEHGKGATPELHDEIELKYKIFLLDGTLCYSSDSSGTIKFHLGEAEQVRGLEEAVMMMVPGDKARLVIPAHLAYGIAGDEIKIPPASALYYEIEILKVSGHEDTKLQSH